MFCLSLFVLTVMFSFIYKILSKKTKKKTDNLWYVFRLKKTVHKKTGRLVYEVNDKIKYKVQVTYPLLPFFVMIKIISANVVYKENFYISLQLPWFLFNNKNIYSKRLKRSNMC